MLEANQLRHEIVNERVRYCWDIFSRYGLVVNGCPTVPISSRKNYSLQTRSLFPSLRPEGIDIADEVERDLHSFDNTLAGLYDPQTNAKLPSRKPIIITDEGELDCSHLAFQGILSKSAYRELSRRKRKDIRISYYLTDLIELLGIAQNTVYANFDREHGILFGSYKISTGMDKRTAGFFDMEEVQKILLAIDRSVLLTEVVEHLENVYGTTHSLTNGKIYDFAKSPQKFVSQEDPFHNFEFIVMDITN